MSTRKPKTPREEEREEEFGRAALIVVGGLIGLVLLVLVLPLAIGVLVGVLAAAAVGLVVSRRRRPLPVKVPAIAAAIGAVALVVVLLAGGGGTMSDVQHGIRDKPAAVLRKERREAHRDARRNDTTYDAPSRQYFWPGSWRWGAIGDHSGGIVALALPTGLAVGGLLVLVMTLRDPRRKRPDDERPNGPGIR